MEQITKNLTVEVIVSFQARAALPPILIFQLRLTTLVFCVEWLSAPILSLELTRRRAMQIVSTKEIEE